MKVGIAQGNKLFGLTAKYCPIKADWMNFIEYPKWKPI